MITVQEKIKTSIEEYESVNRPERLSISRQRDSTKQRPGAKYSPDSKTFEEVEL
ncbi:MAG: hypothetical protein IIA82_07300 [Thaumarchaeota archaeon]|nr:hypothetical protein [Nitrososphaerota archaeon]